MFLALVGCGDDKKDAAQALCDLHFSCDCTPTNFPDVQSCVTQLNDSADKAIANLETLAKSYGLTVDQGCVDNQRQVPASLSCDLEVPEDNTCVACALIHGAQPLGAGCTDHDGISDCARDLTCFNGLCADPCQRLKAGDKCGQGASLARCGENLFCDDDNTKQCQPLGGAGTPCPTNAGCNAATYCADNKVCTAPPKDGEPCGPANLCGEKLYCSANTTCRAIPGNGQPCDVICQENLACEAGTCKPGPGVGEPCPFIGDCGVGTECGEDTCVVVTAEICGLKPDED